MNRDKIELHRTIAYFKPGCYNRNVAGPLTRIPKKHGLPEDGLDENGLYRSMALPKHGLSRKRPLPKKARPWRPEPQFENGDHPVELHHLT